MSISFLVLHFQTQIANKQDNAQVFHPVPKIRKDDRDLATRQQDQLNNRKVPAENTKHYFNCQVAQIV